jgi:hypothetical protein
MSTTYAVLALPLIGSTPYELRAPSGHLRQFESIWNATNRDDIRKRRLLQEYCAIAMVLSQMSLPCRVIFSSEYPATTSTVDHLATIGFQRLTLPVLGKKALLHLMYPRDLLTVLPNHQVLVSSEGDALITMSLLHSSYAPRVSHFGEGGRLHLGNDTAITFTRYFNEDGATIMSNSPLDELRGEGLTVVDIPEAINKCRVGQNLRSLPQNHIDRVTGMLRDPNGKLHLIADPCMESGFIAPDSAPRSNARVTLERLGETCERSGITLHTPKKLLVPHSLGFAQFSTGEVLMTGGEREVQRMVEEIVGSEKVFVTPFPIECIPVRGLAGIHCLVTEFPDDLFVPSAP